MAMLLVPIAVACGIILALSVRAFGVLGSGGLVHNLVRLRWIETGAEELRKTASAQEQRMEVPCRRR